MNQANADRCHQPAGDVFAAITEEKICAASGAETRKKYLLGHAGARQEWLDSRRSDRDDRGEGGAWPGGRIVSHGSQFGSFSPLFESIQRPVEPLTGVRKFRGEFFRHFVADFVAAAADAWAQCGDHVFGPRAEFHLHAAQRFFGDALRRAAPAGMNRGHGGLLSIGQQDGNAVGGLDRQQNAGFARDQGIAFGGLFAMWKFGRAHDVHDVGMNLAQPSDAHFAGTERCVKLRAIFQDAFA